jgi:hypothetical protein
MSKCTSSGKLVQLQGNKALGQRPPVVKVRHNEMQQDATEFKAPQEQKPNKREDRKKQQKQRT